jgi:hypothetical protein
MSRVEQIVDWALQRDLFVIINAHHEEWIKANYSNAAYRARFDSIWSQIAVRFKDKSERLLFEIINEPYGLTKAQNDDLHARILSIIRKTNPTRLVVIQGHNWGGSEDLIAAAIPQDNYIIGSFHSYDPYLFGLQGQGTWGTAADYNTLRNKFISVKTWSDQHNIPILLGEFGSLRTCDYNSRMKHYRAYVELAQQYGFISCAWDDGGDFKIMERALKKWDEVKDILIHTTSGAPQINLSLLQDTIIKVNWPGSSPAPDTIFIEHRTPTGSWSRIASLKGDTVEYFHSGATENMYHHYRIIAKYDDPAKVLYSQPMRIFLPNYVPKTRGYYTGTPAVIPGTVEVENFDTGGEGFTWHDATANNSGGQYRTGEGVDIFSNSSGGYYISSTWTDEWFEQTVNVQQTGKYKVDVYVGSRSSGGSFKFSIDQIETEAMYVPLTGNYNIFKTVSDSMNLSAGQHILRFTIIDDPYFSIDKIVFTAPAVPVGFNSVAAKPFITLLTRDKELMVSLDRHTTVNELRLYNYSGQLISIINKPETLTIIPLNDKQSGVYILQAITNQGNYSDKIIIR